MRDLIKAIREFQQKGNTKTLNIYGGNKNLRKSFLLSLSKYAIEKRKASS